MCFQSVYELFRNRTKIRSRLSRVQRTQDCVSKHCYRTPFHLTAIWIAPHTSYNTEGTLRNRGNGATDRAGSHQQQQRLTPCKKVLEKEKHGKDGLLHVNIPWDVKGLRKRSRRMGTSILALSTSHSRRLLHRTRLPMALKSSVLPASPSWPNWGFSRSFYLRWEHFVDEDWLYDWLILLSHYANTHTFLQSRRGICRKLQTYGPCLVRGRLLASGYELPKYIIMMTSVAKLRFIGMIRRSYRPRRRQNAQVRRSMWLLPPRRVWAAVHRLFPLLYWKSIKSSTRSLTRRSLGLKFSVPELW